MTSTLASQNSSAKASKLPIPIPNTSASTAREDISTTQAKKPPYEARKSAEELKHRLASAVSAKIALSKDGRNSSSNTTSRGIGFLLQRKEQQENRLNTKDISFQKPIRNGGGKPVEITAKNPNNSTKSVNKAELQKSLLSALMNGRGPSGATTVSQNRGKDTRSKLNSDTKGNANKFNKTPLSVPQATNENKSKLDSGVVSGQSRDSRFANGSKLDPSASKTNVSEFNNKRLSTVNPKSENLPSKSSSESSNGTSGGILDRAKNIERLLGQRKRENRPVESTIATKDAALTGKAKNIEPSKTAVPAKPVENGKGIPVLNGRNNQGVNLNKMINTTKPLGSVSKEGNSVLSGRNNGNFKLNKTPKTAQPVEITGKEETASINGENNGKFGVNKSVETRKPFAENFGKKPPPPVAKKPSKENMQRSKQGTPPLDIDTKKSVPWSQANISANGKTSSQNETRTTTKSTSPQIQRKTGALKVNGLHSRNENALVLNGTNSGKDAAFREDLLEKLEADVGSCKIAAFQSMEDFSALRMKVYRIRGELDQLKRDREKRTSMVC